MKALTIFALPLMLFLSACGEPDRPSIALYLAVQRGDLDQLERHIFWKTDINAVLPNGHYPLHVAAEKGRVVMVRTLLKHGAEVNQATADGDTPVDVALLAGRTRLAELLISQGAQLDATKLLLKAAQVGVTNRDVVHFLIDSGADTEVQNEEGDTPLLVAIRQDNHRLATHLVNRGADINAATGDGSSALSLARKLEMPELISLLERQGAL